MSRISQENLSAIVSSIKSHLEPLCISGPILWTTKIGFEADVDRFLLKNLDRIIVLIEDTEALISQDRVLGASATARAALETFAVLHEFIRRFQAAIQRRDGTGVQKTMEAFIFATVEFDSVTEAKTPNIMDALRNADKNTKGVLKAYEVLCEAVHPNWSCRLHYHNNQDLDWDDATLQRLAVAVAFAAKCSASTAEILDGFQSFVSSNRKNIENAILF